MCTKKIIGEKPLRGLTKPIHRSFMNPSGNSSIWPLNRNFFSSMKNISFGFGPSFLFISLLLGGLWGCDLPQPETAPFPIETIAEMTETSGATLTLSDSSLSGGGKIHFKTTLKTIRDSFHIDLQGRFLSPQSFLILHLYFDNFRYDTGIQLRFSMVETQSQAPQIQVEFAEPNRSFYPLTRLGQALTNSHEFHLRVETFNEANNGRRILIWNDQLVLDSQSIKPKDRLTASNAEFDSLRQNMIFYSWGQGLGWGIHMEQMRFTQAHREVPFVNP